MMRYLTLLTATMVCGGAVADEPAATPRTSGSLWTKTSRSILIDQKASRVGDVLTIIVQEAASASSNASTKTSRADKVGFDGVSGSSAGLLSPVGLARNLLGPFGVGNSTSTDGQGQTARSGSLNTRLTVMIKEILPNGNLVVEGSRMVVVNAEKQKVVISGTVRPQDISPANTISSIQLANATVQYDGKGPVGDKQRKGLLSTIFGWLF